MVKFWDVETQQCVYAFQGHMSSIKHVNQSESDPCIFITGARDGKIIVWDTRVPKGGKIREISPAHMPKDYHTRYPPKKRPKKKSSVVRRVLSERS